VSPFGELEGVANQVHQDPLQRIGIQLRLRQFIESYPFEHHPLTIGEWSGRIDYCYSERPDSRGASLEPKMSILGSCQIEHTVDQLEKACGICIHRLERLDL
jgi:hypothetical protein